MHTVDSTSAPPTLIPQLQAAVTGRVIGPDDADYDAARAVMPGNIDRHPAVIVKVADAQDVIRVVAIARDTGTELAVRCGGHSAAGYGVSEGGIVLDLSDMKALDIDVDGRTAWAESGLTAVEYTAAVAEHGLATGFGDTGSVGIGGITLGGGVGYLVRKFGLTIDDLLAAEIVTADGRLLQVDADHHPDLFWAIRGGGGNFGVVTRFRYRLHELPAIVGGMLLLPATAGHRRGVHRGGRGGARRAVDDRQRHALPTDAVRATRAPWRARDHGPRRLRRRRRGRRAGDRAAAGARDTRRRPGPADAVPGDLPTRGSRLPPDGGRQDAVHRPGRSRGRGPHRRPGCGHRPRRSRRSSSAPLGGAMARVPADATAFAHRTSRIMVNVAAFFDGPDDQVVQRGVGDRVRRRARAGRPRRVRQLHRR